MVHWADAMKRDLETATTRWRRNVMRDDSTFGAYEHLASTRPDEPNFERRLNLVQLSQMRLEMRYEDLIRQMDHLP